MEERLTHIGDLVQYHGIKEVFRDKIACFRLHPGVPRIGVPAATYMDMYSFIVVKRGSLSFDINYRKVVVRGGQLLLLTPSV